jgi:pSer/pThr/pTyr-binding forkhead associated (FHA) protein
MADPHIGPSTRPVAPLGSTELLPRVRRAPESAPVAGEALVLVLEDGRQLTVPNGSLRIGRALDNDLVIADSRVSRYHAQIVRDARGPLVRDLGSTNGTAVDGRVVGEDRLTDGDRLTLGGYQIEVRVGPPSGQPPRADWR